MTYMNSEERFKQAVWTIYVCPVCTHETPGHLEPCLSHDPPSLRPLHIAHSVVSYAWKNQAEHVEAPVTGAPIALPLIDAVNALNKEAHLRATAKFIIETDRIVRENTPPEKDRGQKCPDNMLD